MASLIIPEVKCVTSSRTQGRFIAEPIEMGLGVTLGNSLRRVLLNSITGAAVTWVKIDGVEHEFTTIPHIKEDATELLLNIKAIRLRPLSERGGRLFLDASGEVEVTAGSIQSSTDFEVINPQLLIATLDSPEAKLSMELNVEVGRGYLPVEKQKRDDLPLGALSVDAIFTPVPRVNFFIESLKRDDKEYERLILEVWTDGAISPEEALSQGSKALIEQLTPFSNLGPTLPAEEKRYPSEALEQYVAPIEELRLSVRTKNALRRGGINTLGDVLSRSERELASLPGFGERALEEVREALKELGFTLQGGET